MLFSKPIVGTRYTTAEAAAAAPSEDEDEDGDAGEGEGEEYDLCSACYTELDEHEREDFSAVDTS